MNRTTPTSASLRASRVHAIAAAAALLALQAQAAPSAADLQQVKAYGNVSVAQDSAGSWGPWTEFEAPAAGSTPPLGLGRSGGEPYRPIPGTIGGPTETPANVIGWGAFFDNKGEAKQQGCVSIDCHSLQLLIQAQYPSADALLPNSVNATLVPLSTGTPLLSQTGVLLQEDGLPYYVRSNDKELIYAVPDPETANPANPQDIQAAFVRVSLNAYLNGNTEAEPGSQSIYAVVGVATSAPDMAALKGSNTTASYSGWDQYGNGADNVQLTVNFGNSTWTGTWNGGQDGVVQASTSGSGKTVIAGQVGFSASGTVAGSNFQSTSISAKDGTIGAGSTVRGSFYGVQAAAAGGVADIIKSKGDGYTNGRFVSPFLTVKDNPR
ncbi:MAG: hypothetical protein EPO12_02580 [Aquabacterium sp.]|jgi:hypothetical protein|nr:MAG: hypothetical protein EPO12_02580 [Aquabacterium sp.]